MSSSALSRTGTALSRAAMSNAPRNPDQAAQSGQGRGERLLCSDREGVPGGHFVQELSPAVLAGDDRDGAIGGLARLPVPVSRAGQQHGQGARHSAYRAARHHRA
jgi:hypothetical protein